MPRTLFIDADACPVTRESIDCARRAGVAVVIAGNSTQNLERHIRRDDPRDAEHARRGFWVTTLDVSVGADSADFAIVERLQAGDVVVTQDIGLASMVLGRDASAIGVRGRVYDKATIDTQLFIRHEERRCAALAVAPAGQQPSPAKTAPALSATHRVAALTKADFWDMPKTLPFVLDGVSAQDPWLNKNGLQNAMRRRIVQTPCMAILKPVLLGLLRGQRQIGRGPSPRR